jgi:hypothetical protein
MKDHIRIEELFATRALGTLEAADGEELARAVAAHGEDCPECRRLQEEYEEVAGRLAFALAPAEVPEGMADRIVGQPRVRAGWSGQRFRRAAAALAAAALLGVGALGGYVLAPRAAPGFSEAAAYLAEPGIRISPLEGRGPGSLALAFHPGRDRSYLIGSDLRSAPSGEVYELWLMKAGDLLPAATFTPEGDVVVVPVSFDPSTAVQAAVTLERAPGVDEPTTLPLFAGPIQPVGSTVAV